MTKVNPFIGQVFGKLTVMERDFSLPDRWWCQCECGEKRSVARSNLRTGRCYECDSCREKKYNLTGKKFNKWTVIDRAEKNRAGKYLWTCRCECGTIRKFTASYLKDGCSKGCHNCAMQRKVVDITGKRFGRLTVIERDFDHLKDSEPNPAYWRCQCDCGHVESIRSSHLRAGDIKRCSLCTLKERNVKYDIGLVVNNRELVKVDRVKKFRTLFFKCLTCGQVTQHRDLTRIKTANCVNCDHRLQNLLNAYKRSAGKRGIQWDLLDDDFYKIIKETCIYCGSPPARELKFRNKTPIKCNGVDRINSDLGYSLDNCVPCCGCCNQMKLDLSQKSFLEQCNKIAKLHPITV